MRKWTLAVALVALTAAPASAFDDHRKGFVAGFGVGITEVDFEQDFPAGSGYEDPDEDECCCHSQEIVFGWGITDQFLATWNAYRTDRYARGGAALSYFMRPAAPSLFVTGGVSIHTRWNLPLEKDASEGDHVGWWLGAGYEFSPHLSANWAFTLARPDKSYKGIPLDTQVGVFSFVISYLGY